MRRFVQGYIQKWPRENLRGERLEKDRRVVWGLGTEMEKWRSLIENRIILSQLSVASLAFSRERAMNNQVCYEDGGCRGAMQWLAVRTWTTNLLIMVSFL